MDHVSAVVPSVAVTQPTTPSKDLPPPTDVAVPTPTAEQASISDRVFTEPHPATTLIGVLTSAMLLRDVAIDTFDTSGEEEDPEEKRDPHKDEDSAK